MPTVFNPTEGDLEVPAPYLHETQAIVIPAGGGVTVSPQQAEALKAHPVLKVRLEVANDESSSLPEHETKKQAAAINGEAPPVDETDAGDGVVLDDEFLAENK